MTLTSGKHSCTHILNYLYQFTDFNSLNNVYCLSIFPYKSMKQSWPCCNVGQGQPRIIIWANFVGPEFSMLYANFEGHQPTGFREDFLFFFTIYGHSSHLGHMTRIIWIKFCSQFPLRLDMKFGSNGPSGFAAEDVLMINLSDLWERSNNDLDLWYSYVVIYSLSQVFVPTFSSKTSIVQGQLRIILNKLFSPQCCIPSSKIISLLVLVKKIFEGILPYIGMVTILVIWPRLFEQIFFPPSHWGSIWNLALIGPAVSEEKNIDNDGDGRQPIL